MKVQGFVPDAELEQDANQLLSRLGATHSGNASQLRHNIQKSKKAEPTVANDPGSGGALGQAAAQQSVSTSRAQGTQQQEFCSFRGARGSLHQIPLQGNLIVSRPRACNLHDERSKNHAGMAEPAVHPIHTAQSTPRARIKTAPAAVERSESGAAALAQAIRNQAHSRANSRERHAVPVAPSMDRTGQIAHLPPNMIRAPSPAGRRVRNASAGAVARTPSSTRVLPPSAARPLTPSPGAVSSAHVPIMSPGVPMHHLGLQVGSQFLGPRGVGAAPISSNAISPRGYVANTPPRERPLHTVSGTASPAFPSQIGVHVLRYS